MPSRTHSHLLNDEIALLNKLRDGDRRAFCAIYDLYWNRLFVIAKRLISDKEEIEEAIHDVFLRLWQRRESLQLEKPLEHYLAVAIKYEIITRLRKANLRNDILKRNPLHLAEITGEHTITDRIREKELFEELERTVDALPEKCRMVYKLSRDTGFSGKEIANEMNISINTVKTHLAKALSVIKSRFNEIK